MNEDLSRSPAPSGGLMDAFHSSVELARDGHAPFGEQLLILGSGPIPVAGSPEAAAGLDQRGSTVLVVPLTRLFAGTPIEIADQLDRLSELGEQGLRELQADPIAPDELRAQHGRFFGLDESEISRLNVAQRVVLLLPAPPTADEWKALIIELHTRLAAVYHVTDGELVPLEPPAEITRRPSTGRWPASTWLGLFGVVLGAGLVAAAVIPRVLPREEAPPSHAALPAPVRDVATGTPADATNARWIGQSKIVRDSSGRLIVVYAAPEGLQIVTDGTNQGRTWEAPILVDGVTATSFSVAIGGNDDLHVALSNGSGISYARIEATRTGFQARDEVEIDPDDAGPVVDIAWDEDQRVAHIVWAGTSGGGEAPAWAMVAQDTVVQTEMLAEPADTTPVLANIAAGPGSQVIITYRKGDAPAGWFSRAGRPGPDEFVWEPEEPLPTEAGIGAADLAIDDEGRAHLVLRDSTDARLLYFNRTEEEGWSEPQVAVGAGAIENIDFPTLSIDPQAGLVHLFYQTQEFHTAGNVVVAIHDPASGWEGPYQVGSTAEGALYPATIAVDAQPIVIWTKGGDAPAIQAARVVAP